jgi:hypothetical protein
LAGMPCHPHSAIGGSSAARSPIPCSISCSLLSLSLLLVR